MVGRGIISLVYIVVFSIFSFSTLAQENNKTRLELKVRSGEKQPEVVPLGEFGVAVFNPSRAKKSANDALIKFTCYSVEFEKSWETEIAVSKKLGLTKYEFINGQLYLLFHHGNREDLQIVKIDPEDGAYEKFDFYALKRLEINDFTISDNKVYIVGSLRNAPIAQELNLETTRVRTLPAAINGKSVEATDIFINPDNGAVSVTFNSTIHKNKTSIIRSYFESGSKFEDFLISPDTQYDLLTAKLSSPKEDEKLVLGTYGYRKSVNSQGFYIAKFTNDQKDFVRYNSFTDLNNFFAFLNDKEQERIENKVEKRKSKGKDLRVQYRLLIHDIISNGDQNIMIGEAYYPVYKRVRDYNYYNYYNYYSYARSRYRTRVVFDGNQFTHAVIAGFDKQGNLLWDHSFKINEIKTPDLKEKVKVYQDGDEITLFYNLEGKINKITILDNNVVSEAEEQKIASAYEEDKVKKADLGAAEYWYDNYFIAWGQQRIKNAEQEDVKRKRDVFYINKMSF
ncbi:hypothetical protein QQ008_05515 [Fulvivirgaceae bacterium BMA10]|uniref:Uncharacterized protein n=1 Tax=Splendidivirga corallicola TaxID=3051826 RepID=A0ABT8KKR3_9BACT|nr:hypothetical protein [Fulvivirgaceae bacterium BMA10]